MLPMKCRMWMTMLAQSQLFVLSFVAVVVVVVANPSVYLNWINAERFDINYFLMIVVVGGGGCCCCCGG